MGCCVVGDENHSCAGRVLAEQGCLWSLQGLDPFEIERSALGHGRIRERDLVDVYTDRRRDSHGHIEEADPANAEYRRAVSARLIGEAGDDLLEIGHLGDAAAAQLLTG